MRRLIRHLLLTICAVSLVAAGTISFSAAAASAGAPCAHEHQAGSHAPPSSSHHDHHGASCIACCLGACTVIPGLSPRVSVSRVLFSGTPIAYWETAPTLSSRVIAPDLGPPRSRS
jgi:hypothetical protein